MTTGIRVTPDQLRELGARVAAGGGQIEGELRALTAAVAPLGIDWAGDAQMRFLGMWEDWQRAAGTLRDALAGISTLLSQAGEAYAEAEAAIAAIFAVL